MQKRLICGKCHSEEIYEIFPLKMTIFVGGEKFETIDHGVYGEAISHSLQMMLNKLLEDIKKI